MSQHAPLLEIRNLHASVADREILKGVNLVIERGELHALMGPNGSGKSTLAYVLAGHPAYQVTAGEAYMDGQNLLEMTPEQRAQAGLFLSFQQPVEIPGVRVFEFLRASVNALRRARGEPDVNVLQFDRLLKRKVKELGLPPEIIRRNVNEGFSGGERKRAEILQMAVLEPALAVLDEPDSGLDIDAVRTVAEGINRLRTSHRGFLLITHYQRILNYVVPDRVHVFIDGRIIASGDRTLAMEIEAEGYDRYEQMAGVSPEPSGQA